MQTKTKIIAGVTTAVLAAGAAIGIAAASGDSDTPLEGETLDRASDAALESTGGGDVIDSEIGDDGAAYSVEVRLDDGSVVEVNLDDDFNVLGSEPDEDVEGEDDD